MDELTPAHSVVSKACSRYGKEVFKRFFERVLELCVKAGLVTGDKVFADSTLIRSNVSLKSIVPRSDAYQPPRSPKEHIEKFCADSHYGAPGVYGELKEPSSARERQAW